MPPWWSPVAVTLRDVRALTGAEMEECGTKVRYWQGESVCLLQVGLTSSWEKKCYGCILHPIRVRGIKGSSGALLMKQPVAMCVVTHVSDEDYFALYRVDQLGPQKLPVLPVKTAWYFLRFSNYFVKIFHFMFFHIARHL